MVGATTESLEIPRGRDGSSLDLWCCLRMAWTLSCETGCGGEAICGCACGVAKMARLGRMMEGDVGIH